MAPRVPNCAADARREEAARRRHRIRSYGAKCSWYRNCRQLRAGRRRGKRRRTRRARRGLSLMPKRGETNRAVIKKSD